MRTTDDGYTQPGIGLISVGWMGKLHSRAYQAIPLVYPELKIRPWFVHAADTAADRLLDPERLAGPGGGDADLAVQHVGGADGHHVDVGIGEHVAVVGADPLVAQDVAGVLCPVRRGVGRVHEPGPDLQLRVDQRDGLVGAAVQLAHPAHADQADAGLAVTVVGNAHLGVPG